MDFFELRKKIFSLYTDGEYQTGLDLLNAVEDNFPDYIVRITYWKACFYALLNHKDHALATLEKALGEGYWWHPDMLKSENDLISLQKEPRFEKILERATEIQSKMEKTSKPRLITTLPKSQSTALLLAIHARGSNADIASSFWHSAAQLGLTLAIPQSSQIFSPDTYCWDDEDITLAELKAHYQTLPAEPPLILGGMSQGAARAIQFTLSQALPSSGFIAVVPSIDLDEIDSLESSFKAKSNQDIRGYIITGGKDPRREFAYTIQKLMQQNGQQCELKEFPDMGHEYPPNFSTLLKEAINFIFN